jgi:uncharacterized membrane protein YhdT
MIQTNKLDYPVGRSLVVYFLNNTSFGVASFPLWATRAAITLTLLFSPAFHHRVFHDLSEVPLNLR